MFSTVNKPAMYLNLTLQIGKLNVYRNSDAEELAGLHPSDRLMVQLIQIERLGPRVEGMLYRTTFEESWSLIDEVRPKYTIVYRCKLMRQGCEEIINGRKCLARG